MHVWTRQTREKNLETLLAQLSQVDPTRLVVTRQPGKIRHTVAFYSEDPGELPILQKLFGGSIAEVREQDWLAPMQTHPPIRIRDRFYLVEAGSARDPRAVFGDPPKTPSKPRRVAAHPRKSVASPIQDKTSGESPKAARESRALPHPERPEIVIPAGAAFGTGDHPTTATCLRFLCDLSEGFRGKKWSVLDAGTGSGVIAIAAKWLGAGEVEAFDFDPRAVRTARENARLNGQRGIRWSVDDLLTRQETRAFDLVAANIYSELFLAAWPRLRRGIAPGGRFILSGILGFQAKDCRAAIQSARLTVLREVKKGKWVTFLAGDCSHDSASR